MLGVFLQWVGSLFEEISCSVGKREVQKGHETIFMMGFLQQLAALILYGVIIALGFEKFVFNPACLWLFVPRVILEIVGMHITLMALNVVDRSTYGFLKSGTIPLLLLMDVALGYQIQAIQMLAMIMLMGILVFIFWKGVAGKKGLWLMLFSTLYPVLTITLYKYDITHYNSVAGEQIVVYVFLVIYLMLVLRFKTKEKLGTYLRKPVSLVQALTDGCGTLIGSYAYLFAAASIIVTARRSSTVLWSTLSGIAVFKEDHKRLKLFVAFLLIVVLVLLAL